MLETSSPRDRSGAFVISSVVFRLSKYCTKNACELHRFLDQFGTRGVQFFLAVGIKKPQPIAALLCFLAANLDSHDKVLLAQSFVRLNVVRPDGSGCVD